MDTTATKDNAPPQPEARPEGPFSFGVPAAELYEHGCVNRQQVIDRARDLAKITIPNVFPPEGYLTGDYIGEINQSIGAGLVSTLASKLMYMAFPPDRPVLRFEMIEHKLRKDLDANPALAIEIDIGLSRLEEEHRKRLEATNMRSAYVGSTKAELIGGNICWAHLKLDNPVFYLPTHYIVQRDSEGAQIYVIVKQCKAVATLDKDHQRQIMAASEHLHDVKEYERKADIYMVCRRVVDDSKAGYHWEYWEEYMGEVLMDTDQTIPGDEPPPLYASWMIPNYGQNWGPSYCEQYEGDLLLVEGHSASLNDYSASASLLWFFLKPGSRTTKRTLERAQNLTMHIGDAADITVGPDLAQKARDMAAVESNLERAERRLAKAFLLLSSVQRQAERVTAEEFARMAQEINEATGGLYAEKSQSSQRVIVHRFVVLHNEDDRQLPKLPPGVFRVAVITGAEAMGRTVEGQTLTRETAEAMDVSGGAVAKYIDWHGFIRRKFSSAAIPLDGIVRTPEAQAAFEQQAKQDAMKQTMVEKGVGPAVTAAGKMMPPQGAPVPQEPQPQGAPETGVPQSPQAAA